MRTRWFQLRGRRPRRAGVWGFRSTWNTTMALAPLAIGFVRRALVRGKRVPLRINQPAGMPANTTTTLAGPTTHPALRRRRVGMRLIQPGRPPL